MSQSDPEQALIIGGEVHIAEPRLWHARLVWGWMVVLVRLPIGQCLDVFRTHAFSCLNCDIYHSGEYDKRSHLSVIGPIKGVAHV